jgi:hypothetical protein
MKQTPLFAATTPSSPAPAPFDDADAPEEAADALAGAGPGWAEVEESGTLLTPDKSTDSDDAFAPPAEEAAAAARIAPRRERADYSGG